MNELEPIGPKANSYIQRLDLAEDPFSDDFENDFFYRGAMRQQVMEQAVHFSRFTDHVVVLVGSTGSGTSRVLDEILEQLHQIMDCCDIDGEEEPTPDLILASLAKQLQFQQPPPDLQGFLEALRDYTYLGEELEPLLVAVDQAHFLAIESYELLLSLLKHSGGAIRLLLVGEYQTEQLAKLSGFPPDQIKILELDPLTLEESGEYIFGLLGSVGYAGEQPLSTDQLAILHEQSGGNLTQINQLAAELLAVDDSVVKTGFKIKIPVAHLLAIVILACSLAYSYWYMGAGETVELKAEGTQQEKIAVVERPLPVAEKPISPNSTSGSSKEHISADNERNLKTVDTDNKSEVEGIHESTLLIQAAAQGRLFNDESLGQELSSQLKLTEDVIEEPVIATKIEAGVDNIRVNLVKIDESAVEGVADLPIEPVKIATKITEISAPEIASSHDKILPKSKIIEKLATVITEIKGSDDVSQGAVLSTRDQSILGLASDLYMLQLAGSVNEQRIKSFVKKYAGKIPITYIETLRKNKPWYIALSGPHNSLKDAKNAIASLPQELQKAKPWIKQVGTIQSEIKKRL